MYKLLREDVEFLNRLFLMKEWNKEEGYSNEKVIIFDEYDGEDIDMSWFDELTPEEQEKELLKLKKSMFIKEDTDR